MARPVLREWSGERLVYVSPHGVCEKFGYPGPGVRADVTPDEVRYFGAVAGRVPLQDGEVAAERADLGGPAAAAEHVKAAARELGADLVGIARVDPYYVYEGRELPHRYAVVVGMAMDLEEILQVPRVEANVEYLRVYEALGRLNVELARRIRAHGYPARAHTLADEGLAMLPHAYAAGLGELGKHGSLINRELGCSFRLGVVTTDLELAEDSPRDEGIQDFCNGCRMCVTYCPGAAISDEKALVRGAERWVVDTERCTPYFASHYACAVCLQVCPINAKAFGGRFRDAFVETVGRLDAGELKARLDATLPEPWSALDPPAAIR